MQFSVYMCINFKTKLRKKIIKILLDINTVNAEYSLNYMSKKRKKIKEENNLKSTRNTYSCVGGKARGNGKPM